MKSNAKKALVADINITPFTDVILVLLIVFMIATPILSESTLNVDLPKASHAAQQGERTDVSLTIAKNNVIYLNGKPVSQDELKQKMTERQKRSSKISVTLKIDQQVEFKNVVNLLDLLKGLGLHNFNIAAVRN